MRTQMLVVAALCALPIAAALPEADTPDELIRQANAALQSGDLERAGHLYARAEERTHDPGLVAFNRAALHVQQGEFREAELHYARALDDANCPPERAARAWFNRGTCLVRRGGSAAVFRSAIACFEQCLDSASLDEPLKADTRHNLELAKLLWNEARRTTGPREMPNDPPPPEEEATSPPPPKPSVPDAQAGTKDATGAEKPKTPTGTPEPIGPALPKSKPTETPVTVAGNNAALPPLKDDDQLQPLSEEDTREYLKRTAERLKREQRAIQRTLAGAERPGVRDW